MADFNGTSYHTIDSKGRLFVPQEHRNELGIGFVLSLSEDLQTMAFYPKEVWEEKCVLMRKPPKTDAKAHQYLRLIHGNTFKDLAPDSQGRVQLPAALRTLFDLNEGTEAVLVGAGESLELWNRRKFELTSSNMTQSDMLSLLDYMNTAYFAPGGYDNDR